MFKRTIRKFVGGMWMPIKWQDVTPGDMVRIYEKGMLSEDTRLKVLASCNTTEIDGKLYENILTDKGEINSKGRLSPQIGIRNPHKKKNRQRRKDVLK